jgi:hypothetical protein
MHTVAIVFLNSFFELARFAFKLFFAPWSTVLMEVA